MTSSKIVVPIEIKVGEQRYIDKFSFAVVIETGGEVIDGHAIVHIESAKIEGEFIEVAESQDMPTLLRYIADVMERNDEE